MIKKTLSYIFLFTTMLTASLQAQEPTYVQDTWKTMRVINGQSVETVWDNYLLFTVTHRFLGTVDMGIDEFFGMDLASNTRLGLAYGLTNDLMLGIGRSSAYKIYDGFVKYRVLRQQEQGMPLTLTFFANTQIDSRTWEPALEASTETSHRMAYVAQLLLARKLSDQLSVQLSPTLVHKNLVVESNESNTSYALGMAARFQLTEVMAIQSEYFLRLTDDELSLREQANVFGVAIDFTTAKHSFQLQFSNIYDITEADFLTNTTDDFFDKGIHFGFNITRKFGL